MTQIMIAREKHGNRYISLEKGLGPTAMALLVERYNAGWYIGEDKARAEKAASALDPTRTPWRFLSSRSRHEYENVEIVDLEELV